MQLSFQINSYHHADCFGYHASPFRLDYFSALSTSECGIYDMPGHRLALQWAACKNKAGNRRNWRHTRGSQNEHLVQAHNWYCLAGIITQLYPHPPGLCQARICPTWHGYLVAGDTTDTAIFIEGKKGMPPAFAMSYSFATIGQMAIGESIIVMPLSIFLRLSEKMEKLSAKTVFLYNTARCGGTLVTNILEHTGRVVAWNEPRVLDNIFRQANHAWNRKTSKLVLQAAIKMLTKPFSGYDNDPLAYVIKLCAAYGSHWRMFHDVAPEATKLFLYRDLNATAESQKRVITVVPSFNAVLCAASLTANPHALPGFLSQTMFTGSGWSDMPVRYSNVWEWSYRLSLINLKSYLDMRQNGIHIPAFKYEDLLANPQNTVTVLLKAVGIPQNLACPCNESHGTRLPSQCSFQPRSDGHKEDPSQSHKTKFGIPGWYARGICRSRCTWTLRLDWRV